jgi:CheY-like chemotaxis protein
LYSEPNHGTCFKVYLPRIDAPVSKAEEAAGDAMHGTETVIVVEDMAAVRAVTCEMLKRFGFTVYEAADGITALQIVEQLTGPIDLLLTDVVMPDINGRDLAARFQQLRPHMKVLFMSGYTDDAVVRHGILQEGIAYLQKPFTPTSLVRRVREVLDGS